jgi:hypothetical protein
VSRAFGTPQGFSNSSILRSKGRIGEAIMSR